jgi:hypothetical protein
MSYNRPVIALDVRCFGRGPNWIVPTAKVRAPIGDDVKLFTMTFFGGFVFVSMLLA